MSAVPAVLAAGRAIAPRVGAWVSTAEFGALSKLKSFLAAHPAVSSTFASLGISGVIDAAMSGDTDSIQALNDFADQAGIGHAVADNAGRAVNFVRESVSSMFDDGETLELSDSDAEKTRAGRELALFIKDNVSTNPGRIMRYHAQMREFMNMDSVSLSNLLKAYM